MPFIGTFGNPWASKQGIEDTQKLRMAAGAQAAQTNQNQQIIDLRRQQQGREYAATLREHAMKMAPGEGRDFTLYLADKADEAAGGGRIASGLSGVPEYQQGQARQLADEQMARNIALQRATQQAQADANVDQARRMIAPSRVPAQPQAPAFGTLDAQLNLPAKPQGQFMGQGPLWNPTMYTPGPSILEQTETIKQNAKRGTPEDQLAKQQLENAKLERLKRQSELDAARAEEARKRAENIQPTGDAALDREIASLMAGELPGVWKGKRAALDVRYGKLIDAASYNFDDAAAARLAAEWAAEQQKVWDAAEADIQRRIDAARSKRKQGGGLEQPVSSDPMAAEVNSLLGG